MIETRLKELKLLPLKLVTSDPTLVTCLGTMARDVLMNQVIRG